MPEDIYRIEALLDASCTARSGNAAAVQFYADHRHLCFASPVRPNPIASLIVQLISIDGTTLQVRGLDCVDGTPLLDLKPERGAVADQ
jgi:tRNA-methyltransferase O